MTEFLSKHGTFTADEVAAFNRIGYEKSFAAKDFIFSATQVFDKLYFIKSGIIRSYRLIDGEDLTDFFYFPNEFAVDFQSFLTDKISPLFFNALTDAEVIVFKKKDIYDLYEKYPKFEKIGRLMAENAFLMSEERVVGYQTDDLKTRYLKLVAKNPILFKSVPQHYIASYLGVKPQSLSRVRADISGKKY